MLLRDNPYSWFVILLLPIVTRVVYEMLAAFLQMKDNLQQVAEFLPKASETLDLVGKVLAEVLPGMRTDLQSMMPEISGTHASVVSQSELLVRNSDEMLRDLRRIARYFPAAEPSKGFADATPRPAVSPTPLLAEIVDLAEGRAAGSNPRAVVEGVVDLMQGAGAGAGRS